MGKLKTQRRYIVYQSRRTAPAIPWADVVSRFPEIVLVEDLDDQKVVLMPEEVAERLSKETNWEVEEDLQCHPLLA